MKKVFNDTSSIIDMFIKQEQYEAMTPLVNIEGNGKGRRLYFKGDTIYSYRDSFPLARLEGDTVYLKHFCPSMTTKKHAGSVRFWATHYQKNVIYSDDLKTPVCLDFQVKRSLSKLMNARRNFSLYKYTLKDTIENDTYPITKSKFPLLFDEKHEKVRNMLFSNDTEAIRLAIKIIKQNKLVK